MTDFPGRWANLNKLLNRRGPLVSENFVPGDQSREIMGIVRVLVIGAGGLGCELLKDLALSGFKNIDVIDMDKIEVTNLNRQFLFRAADVGKPKAEVAAAFVTKRVPGVTVTPHFGAIQEQDEAFFKQFHIVVLGLDSIDARRWINSLICSFVKYDEDGKVEPGTAVPVVDGGTEGLKGHVKVIWPGTKACFECSMDLFPPETKFPLCTLAETPRTPAHCIEWAKILAFPEAFPGKSVDTDSPDDMQWVFQKAKQRAEECGIEGVTLSLTQGVAKNIIPAVASTNAIIAAACVNEALKIVTGCSLELDNYLMYNGAAGVYTHAYVVEKLESCLACSLVPIKLSLESTTTLGEFRKLLQEDAQFQLKKPSVLQSGNNIYMVGPFEKQFEKSLTNR
eukprot:JP446243.1.p1 GENE.JP446243.1~~JP446243.1.p1  ORF type:complete len:394 (+),score=103.47 JP446243.1:68-1249(+)